MKRILRKILSRKGESLVETLCAVLIFTLASVAMYSMIMAAGNINDTAKTVDRQVQSQMLVVEKAEGDGIEQTLTMKITPKGGSALSETIPVEVELYQAEDNGLFSYFRSTGG